MGFDEAVGFTVNQHLFMRSITHTALAKRLGIAYPGVGNRLRGRIKWTAADLATVAEVLGVPGADLFPTRGDDGWVPAPYVPGTQKAPVPSGTEASGLVAGAGFEPATSGFQVVSWMVTLAEAILPLLRAESSARARIQRKQSGQCKHSLTASPNSWGLAS